MKKYKFLLLNFVFLGMLLSSFHYHNNVIIDDDCPICIVKNNLDNSADVVLLPLDTFRNSCEQNVINNEIIYTFKILSNRHSRAPPKFS